MLCFAAMELVHEPFAVINADDFYGYDAFKKAENFLQSECTADRYAIIGYDLLKTLSENGTVNRGVCAVDSEGNLIIHCGKNQCRYEEWKSDLR